MIAIKNLTKVYESINYNVVALSNLNFVFDKGEVIVILGRSGSGKSTFLNVLGGFDNTYSGSYFFRNNEFKTLENNEIDAIRSKKIGFIFQHQVLFNNLTVIENIELSLNVLGITNTKKKRLNAMKALTLVGLRRHAHKLPWQLSGGEKQRVAIARAIVKDPEVIICDEPTAALDSVTSKEVLDLLASVCKNKLLIIATHNKSIVKNYGTRIIELKSGYVVRDELVKEDKSNIKVDEMDMLLDEDLYGLDEEDYSRLNNELLAEKVGQSQILNDLELDLSQYKERKEKEFRIDSKEKSRVIQQRKEQFSIEDRFDSVSDTQELMVNTKHFSKMSALSHWKTYLFFSFFLITFIITSVVGMNLTAGIFMKNDNTDETNYQLFRNNQIIQLGSINGTKLFIDDKNQTVDKLKEQFINNTNLDEFSDKENEVILNDYSFNFRYNYDIYHEIEDYLIENDYEYSMYYDPQNIVVEEKNIDIIFDNLQSKYSVEAGTNQLTMRSLINNEANIGISALYIENIKEQLMPYLIGDSRLPKEDNEVILSVETLINSDILGLKNYSNINEVYRSFKRLDNEQKYIEVIIPKMKITNKDNDKGYEIEETGMIKRYKIVGLYNAGENIESYYTNKEHITMIFSNKTKDTLNIQIENNTEDLKAYLIPLYMEINKDTYNTGNISQVIDKLQKDYLQDEYDEIYTVLSVYKRSLETALINLSADLNGDIIINLDDEVDPVRYPSLNYGELRKHYIANYGLLLSDNDKLDICSTCLDYDYDTWYSNGESILSEQVWNEVIEGLANPNSLANERTINYLLFTYQWDKFNNSNRIINENEVPFSSLKLSYTNSIQKSTYFSLFTKVQTVIKGIGMSEFITISDQSLKTIVLSVGKFFINPSLLLKGLSASASNILIIVLMSIFSIILTKLFKDIYQLFLINRRREFGSLRILGAKFEDIKIIMKLEGRILLLFSYGVVIFILLLFKYLAYVTRNNVLVFSVYQPLAKFFVNIRVSDFFNINLFSLISVFILVQVLFKKQLIDENIDKNLKDKNMLKTISDWDGE